MCEQPAGSPQASQPAAAPGAQPPAASTAGTSQPSAARIVRVVVKLGSGCSRTRLSVSGTGVKLSAATRLPPSRCRLTLRVSAGARRGSRELRLKTGRRTRTVATIRL